MFDKLFEQLGFTKKEAQIYLSLVMLGKANVQQLCAQTQIFRTSIYSVLNRLIEKNLVSRQVEQKKGRQVEHFVPNDPNVLFDHIRHERASLADKESLTKQLVSQISKHFEPKMRYETGQALVQEQLKDFFDNQPTSRETGDSTDTLLIYVSDDFYQAYCDQLLSLIKAYKRPIRLLLADETMAETFLPIEYVSVKIANASMVPNTSLLCYSSQVLLVVCQKVPNYTFLIKDETLAEDCRRLLSNLWINYTHSVDEIVTE